MKPRNPPPPPPRKARSTGEARTLARPNMDRLVKEDEQEIDRNGGNDRPDEPNPNLRQDDRQRCVHGRLFNCIQCDDKAQEAKLEARRVKMQGMLGQFHKSVFNIAAIITGDDNIRLNETEAAALSESGSSAVAYVAPEASLGAIAVVGYVTNLGGCITGKILDASKAKANGQQGANDRRGEEVRKDGPNAAAPAIRIG